MIFNPHKLGVHKLLKHIPLGAVFDIPYKRALKKAVNIADLRLIAKSRSHKVSEISALGLYTLYHALVPFILLLNRFVRCADGFRLS
jgi:hypothetical protein